MDEARVGGDSDLDRDELGNRCAELEARLAVLLAHEAGHDRLLQAIRHVTERVSRLRNSEFFRQVTIELAAALGADVAWLGRLQDDGASISTLAMVVDGRLSEVFVYPLKSEPCRDAISGCVLTLRDAAARLYPDSLVLQRFGIRGYVGVALYDSDGTPIGIMAGLYREGIENPELAQTLMSFFAPRAALELQQERIERRSRALRRLMDSNAVGIVVADSDGRILDANDAYLSVIGYDRGDIARGLRWNDITPPEYRAVDSAALADLREQGVTGPREKAYVRKDGTRVDVLVGGAMLEREEQRIIAFVLDETPRKRSERERDELLVRERVARAEAQEALQARDRFLAMLSHELRNPLTPIVTAVEVLRRVAPVDQRIQNALGLIDRNVRHQMTLINDLLDLARVARGALSISPEPLQFDRLLAEAVRAAEEDARRAGLHLTILLDSNVWIRADPTRMNQVALNLLSNAFKFTPSGGRVTITLRRHGPRARLTVEDTGIGIAPELLPRLFAPFVRGDEGAVRPGGLGIGLAIVRSLIELQGGRVWAESEGVGRGARFIVELPAQQPLGRPSDSQPLSDAGRNAQVVLVEDDEDAREMLAAGLRLHGHEVVTCRSGEDALQAVRSARAGVLLADLTLPDMDGGELLRRIRELPGGELVVGVALTTFASAQHVQQARDAGFVELLVKPVDIESLAHRLAELVDTTVGTGPTAPTVH